MKYCFTFLASFAAFLAGFSQAFDYQWSATNSPSNSYRFDDCFFINADTGLAINFAYSNNDGYVMRTFDGAQSWHKVWDSTGIPFRDIAFIDSNHGFIGTLENGLNSGDTIIMYETSDGGSTWNPVANLPGPRPAGICGMHALNDSTVFAVGRYYGPAGFYKTTDRGQNWSYVNLDSLAGGLVDVFFHNADTGIAVGSNGNYFTGRGIVLETYDGGNSWHVAHVSAHTNEICWKISFPSRNIGYVSLQAFANSGWQWILRTTDGGQSWFDSNVSIGGGPIGTYNVEGIGFVNDSVGWIGGDLGTFMTTDSGNTWLRQSWGNTINRFRFLNDSLAFGAGEKMYKMDRTLVGISSPQLNQFALNQNYPNPFQEQTVFEYNLPEPNHVQLDIFDSMGKMVAKLIDSEVSTGTHRLIWSVDQLPNGIYYYTLKVGTQQATRRLVIHR